MKKLATVFAGMFFLVVTLNAQSQKGADYFAGKWKILVKGLPDGDTRMTVNLTKKDTTLVGSIDDSTGTEVSDFSKVELKDSVVTVYFTAQGYDVNLLLKKKDADHVSGSMMNMFDAEGDRVKAIKQ